MCMERKYMGFGCIRGKGIKGKCMRGLCMRGKCIRGKCMRSKCMRGECMRGNCMRRKCMRGKCMRRTCIRCNASMLPVQRLLCEDQVRCYFTCEKAAMHCCKWVSLHKCILQGGC